MPLLSMLAAVFVSAAAVRALSARADSRLWIADSILDGLTHHLRPIVADAVCEAPLHHFYANTVHVERGFDISVHQLGVTDCDVAAFTLRCAQEGGILATIGGLKAAAAGRVRVTQQSWPNADFEADFAAQMLETGISVLFDVFVTPEGKAALHVREAHADISLKEIALENIRGLNTLSMLLTYLVRQATGLFTEKRIQKHTSNLTHVLDHSFPHLPVGRLAEWLGLGHGGAALGLRLGGTLYAPPTWRVDARWLLSEDPGTRAAQAAASSYSIAAANTTTAASAAALIAPTAASSAATALPTLPPPRHRKAHVVGALSLAGGLESLAGSLEQLGEGASGVRALLGCLHMHKLHMHKDKGLPEDSSRFACALDVAAAPLDALAAAMSRVEERSGVVRAAASGLWDALEATFAGEDAADGHKEEDREAALGVHACLAAARGGASSPAAGEGASAPPFSSTLRCVLDARPAAPLLHHLEALLLPPPPALKGGAATAGAHDGGRDLLSGWSGVAAELAEVTGLLSAAAAVRASPLWPEGVVVDVDDGRLWVSANLSFRPGRTVEGEAAAFGALLGAEDWRR